MTDRNAEAPGTASRGPAYESLAALRDAHLALRRTLSDPAAVAGRDQRIREFLTPACNAGAFIRDARERRVAQGILDFWSAELATSQLAQPGDFSAQMLAPYDAATASASPGDRPVQNLDDQRALIRLAALARQWRDSGKRRGYLLYGDAVGEAARFADRDPDLAEFVIASQDAVSGRKKMVLGGIGGFVIAALTVAAGFYYWQFTYLPHARDTAINEAKFPDIPDPARRAETLRWLSGHQLWLPPYDLSGADIMTGLKLPGLMLSAPNFSHTNFDGVEFTNADIKAASFSESEFSFGSSGNSVRNDFSKAALQGALFRNAKIASTSFAGADLYRAIFDRAILCDVDFSEASLRSASFWAVTADKKTKANLKHAAWWLAVGWPWSEIEELAVPHEKPGNGPAQNAEDDARNRRLKESRGFLEEMRRPAGKLARAAPGSRDRAVALNDVAWTHATWGVDLFGPKSTGDPCAATGVPANGLQAAEQAVCIVDRLNGEGEKKGAYKELLLNIKDTLAYVQMQRNEMPDAVKTFEEILKDDPGFLEKANNESSQFRYAIAQYATSANDQDRAAATKRFNMAVKARQYRPSHEIQTLRDYIFPVGDFVDVLRTSNNSLWPEVHNTTKCPAATSGGAK
jgi:Pentapeptide repeats (8 copies)